jgi:hypothetical protein
MSHQLLKAVVRDVRESVVIKECTTDAQGKALITFTVAKEADLELIISTTDVNEVVYSVSLEVSPQCDQCPCIGKPQCFTTAITSSITLIYISTFCIATNTPSLAVPFVSTIFDDYLPLTEFCVSTTKSHLLSYQRLPSVFISPSRSPSNPISNSLLCSTTTIRQTYDDRKTGDNLYDPLVDPSIRHKKPTRHKKPIQSHTHDRKSVHHKKHQFCHHATGCQWKVHGAVATNLDADTKESKTFGVYVALICIIAVQSVMILGGLIWWCCFGREAAAWVLYRPSR